MVLMTNELKVLGWKPQGSRCEYVYWTGIHYFFFCGNSMLHIWHFGKRASIFDSGCRI